MNTTPVNATLLSYLRALLCNSGSVILVALMVALPARAADLPYADFPLFWATGVKPNVALMIDTSGSMGDQDTASTATTSICNGGPLTVPMSRMNAAKEAACQIAIDNAASMRIGLYRFTGGNNGLSVVPFGATEATLRTGISGLSASGGTPLTSALRVILNDYIGASSPIQYRCQRNYTVFFTDGAPTTGSDLYSPLTFPALSTAQSSKWFGSTSSSGSSSPSPAWDGYTDPLYNPDGANVYTWLDDLSQFAYDVDFRTNTSAATTCPSGASAVGRDCAGKRWDGNDDTGTNATLFAKQNMTTFTIGFGARADNELLRDTSVTDLNYLGATNVDAAADTITIQGHRRETGDYAIYYANKQNVNVTVRGMGNTGTEEVTTADDISGMVNGAALTYNNAGGTALQYVSTAAVPPAACGSIGGLTSGSTYYVARTAANTFRLSTDPTAATYCATGTSMATNCIDLTTTGATNTVHTFSRAAIAGVAPTFNSNTSGTTPLNPAANIEKITINNHGLNTGDFIRYTCSGTNCRIGGLTSGNNYFVAKLDNNTFRLATQYLNSLTCAAAADGTAAVSAANSCIALSYPSNSGRTETFTRAAVTATAPSITATGSVPTPVNTNTGSELITTAASNGFGIRDVVTYTCTAFAGTPDVLSSATTYYAVKTSPTTFKLALSATDATALPTPITVDIANGGNASQTFSFSYPSIGTVIGGLYPYVTDADTIMTTVTGIAPTSTANAVRTFTVASTAGWTSSNPITFQNIKTTSPYTTLINLVDGQDYYPIILGATTLQLANSAANAALGVAISNTCSSTCSSGSDFRFARYPVPATNDEDKGKYYLAKIDDNTLKLAYTKNQAALCVTDASKCIDIGSGGEGYLSFGPGRAYVATSAASLSASLKAAFSVIKSDALSQASVATNTAQLGGGAQVYRAIFNSGDWSGDLSAYAFDSATKTVAITPTWSASQQVPPAGSRTILTSNSTGTGGISFTAVGTLTSTNQTALGPVVVDRQKVLDWVRGKDDATLLGSRSRTNGVLGDILGGSPIYIGQPSSDYDTILPASDPGKPLYAAFKSAVRNAMVYAGANDGMLHGFNANTGVEVVGYIPGAVFTDWTDTNDNGLMDTVAETTGAIKKFWELAQIGYGLVSSQPHRYFVDGAPSAGDAYFGGSWHTVLVGGLGRGGRSVYALDVTNPSGFGPGNVLWEFTGGSPAGSMGYSYSKPVIARLQTGQWAAIFGNGYDGNGDLGRLFILDIQTGAIIKQINATGSVGLSSVSVLADATGTATTVYAGDLAGNVWKFDISPPASAAWSSTVSTPLFIAYDTAGNRQPITSAIRLGTNPAGSGPMLYFGTGTYFQDTDKDYVYPTSPAKPRNDTLYGLWDNGTSINSNKSELQQQVMSSSGAYRLLTSNPVSYVGTGAGSRGWYIDLVVNNIYEGERIIYRPLVVNQVLIVTTIIPSSTDACTGGGRSWVLGMEALTGGSGTIFDTNGDGTYEALAGIESTVGVYSEASYLAGYGDDGTLIIGGSGGLDTLNFNSCLSGCTPPGFSTGRMTWRQLQ